MLGCEFDFKSDVSIFKFIVLLPLTSHACFAFQTPNTVSHYEAKKTLLSQPQWPSTCSINKYEIFNDFLV